ncbi:MAG: helix-turn-helix domain-containing protein [Candidatus Cloacimonadaceae bacterium]|nr:helix-turn-helix domain-containing protein [Candidatus Cloacimonadaceae bacterium]
MKATTYETGEKVVKTDHCDNYGTATIVTVLSIREDTPLMLITKRFEQCDNKNRRSIVTVVPKQTTTATIRKPVIVTVLLAATKDYSKRLKMSRRKIKAVWLTVERVAELMNCSTRTVWRYVNSHQIKVHKQQIQLGSSKVIKSFLLTETDILMKEMADCELKGIIPGKFIEKSIEVDGKNLNSALIYQYAENISKEGGYYGAL